MSATALHLLRNTATGSRIAGKVKNEESEHEERAGEKSSEEEIHVLVLDTNGAAG